MTITLCAVDTAHHLLTRRALDISSQMHNFDKIMFITDKDCNLPAPWEWCKINTFKNGENYNQFVLKKLVKYIKTDHVLLIQYDGFAINPELWSPEFLNYDYIGAPWRWHENYQIGNGGFSLRSKKLLNACLDRDINLSGYNINNKLEDVTICRFYRSLLEIRHGIHYAPLSVAEKFSVEYAEKTTPTFGFHGFHHLHNFYRGDNFPYLLNNLQPYVFKKFLPLQLALEYNGNNCKTEASLLIHKFFEYNPIDTEKYAEIALRDIDTQTNFNDVWNLLMTIKK